MRKRIFIIVVLCGFVGMLMAHQTYTVKQGEDFESIASYFGVTVNELKSINPNVEILFPGLLLNIPDAVKPVETTPIQAEVLRTDRINMRDDSYVLCKIISVKQGKLTIKQEGEEGTTVILLKDAASIEYADGTKRKFRK